MCPDFPNDLQVLIERQIDMLPNVIDGRAATSVLRVSPNGDGTDGLSWRTAYQTLENALDAASTDANEQTRILVVPGTYNINRTGNPTWSCNVEIRGTHRNWSIIENNHASATAIIRFTGRVSLVDLTFDCGSGDNDGVIIDNGSTDGCRIRRVYIECENVTGAQTAIELLGGTKYARLEDVDVHGNISYTLGLLVNNCELSNFDDIEFHECLTGIQFIGSSDQNHFHELTFDDCTLGIDIDSGANQIFHYLIFHGCVRNVDDEVGNHHWSEIKGDFDVEILPDDLVGTTITTAAGANNWGSDTELLSAASRDNPFRVIAIHHLPSASGWFSLRFSDDNGSTFYDILLFDATKREGIAAPSGTEHIFNRGTRVSAAARSDSGNDNIKVWVEVQEI